MAAENYAIGSFDPVSFCSTNAREQENEDAILEPSKKKRHVLGGKNIFLQAPPTLKPMLLHTRKNVYSAAGINCDLSGSIRRSCDFLRSPKEDWMPLRESDHLVPISRRTARNGI